MTLLLSILLSLGCVTPQKVKQSDARTDLGTAYLKEGNPPSAVDALRRAVKLNPQNGTAWERLGLAYMASEALPESEKAFQKAIKVGITEEPGRVYYNYGLLLVKMERFDEALTQFDVTLADLTYRTPAKVLNSKGFVLYSVGRYDEAIKTLSDALNRVPKMCPARFHRALSFQAKGEMNDALRDFDAVIKTCGDTVPGAYFHAAQVLVALGKKEDGCAFLRTARDRSPDSALERAADAMLQQECGT